MASATVCVRLRVPSFAFAFLKWLRTVSSPTPSVCAVSCNVRPIEACRNTSDEVEWLKLDQRVEAEPTVCANRPDLDPSLAFELSRIYGLQTRYEDVTRSILQAIYIRPVGENMEGLYYYYGDAVIWDTALLKVFQDILPQIDRVLRSR